MSTRLVFILALSFLGTSSLTVSGFSGGGFFSTQLHVAYSQSISGVAVVAGGPYWCYQSSKKFLPICLGEPNLVDLQASINFAEAASANGEIDNVSNLASARVYVFSGIIDSFVPHGVVIKTAEFYQHFVTSGSIVTNFNLNAEHGWSTNWLGSPCNVLQYLYI
jgi:pimeloyl-ACP methyl ester carboxylesterase